MLYYTKESLWISWLPPLARVEKNQRCCAGIAQPLIQCGSKFLQGCRKGSLYCSDEVTAAARWSHKSEEICYGPVLRVQLYCCTRYTSVYLCVAMQLCFTLLFQIWHCSTLFYSIFSNTYFTAKSQDIIRYKMAWYKKLLHFFWMHKIIYLVLIIVDYKENNPKKETSLLQALLHSQKVWCHFMY